MAQIIPNAYVNFRRYLSLRDKVGHEAAVKEIQKPVLEDILDFIVSCGSQQNHVTVGECEMMAQKVDSEPSGPVQMADDFPEDDDPHTGPSITEGAI